MKLRLPIVLSLLLAVSCQSTNSHPQPPHEIAPATAEHEWLQQLVGEWKVSVETNSAPGEAPTTMESTERVRAIGGLWVVADGDANMDGANWSSVMTLGYDPGKQHFVGTWIDSLQTYLWTYRGALDEARKVLTLEAEGPGFEDPTTLASYRDQIELVDANHKRLVSSVRNPDGSWTEYMRAEYVRVK